MEPQPPSGSAQPPSYWYGDIRAALGRLEAQASSIADHIGSIEQRLEYHLNHHPNGRRGAKEYSIIGGIITGAVVVIEFTRGLM